MRTCSYTKEFSCRIVCKCRRYKRKQFSSNSSFTTKPPHETRASRWYFFKLLLGLHPGLLGPAKSSLNFCLEEFWPNPGSECLPLDSDRRDVEFAGGFASVASLAVSLAPEFIFWNLVKTKELKHKPTQDRYFNGIVLFQLLLCWQMFWASAVYNSNILCELPPLGHAIRGMTKSWTFVVKQIIAGVGDRDHSDELRVEWFSMEALGNSLVDLRFTFLDLLYYKSVTSWIW